MKYLVYTKGMSATETYKVYSTKEEAITAAKSFMDNYIENKYIRNTEEHELDISGYEYYCYPYCKIKSFVRSVTVDGE